MPLPASEAQDNPSEALPLLLAAASAWELLLRDPVPVFRRLAATACPVAQQDLPQVSALMVLLDNRWVPRHRVQLVEVG